MKQRIEIQATKSFEKEEAILIAFYHPYHNLLAFLLIKLSWHYEKIADMTSDIVVSVFDIIISDSARYV